MKCCAASRPSSLVSALAEGNGSFERRDLGDRDAIESLNDICAQASELAAPVPDYEEAARQAGYKSSDATTTQNALGYWVSGPVDVASGFCSGVYDSWEHACSENDIDPIDREIYEHWAVSSWLAEKLIAAGEKVNTDFAELNVWARTATGQGIASDQVIQGIYEELVK